MAELSFGFHLIVFLLLIVALLAVVANVACFGSLRPQPARASGPLVSVLVPARNEVLNIERCVRSLLAQDWPNLQIVVLDDRSEDGTGELLRRFDDPRLRILSGAELPAGWVGKNWACHQLGQAALGEWLLFTDADTEHGPGAVTAAVDHAEKTRADLLSAWPRLITKTIGEQLIVPMIVFVGMVCYPHSVVTLMQHRPDFLARVPRRYLRGFGAANGQFLLFRRSSYDRIGGHAGLKDHLVEDVAFGRAIAERMGEGMRLVNCDSIHFSTCRMYRSFRETWEGFTKNARAAFEENIAAFLGLGAYEFICFVWPFLALFSPYAPKGLVVAEIAIIFSIRALLAVRFQTSWLSVVLHPVGLLLALAIGMNSWVRSTRGGVLWKGRRYTLGATLSNTAGADVIKLSPEDAA